MGYDKRFKRFKEFVEDTGTRPMGMSVAPNDYKRCPECGGTGRTYTDAGARGWGNSASGRTTGTCWKCQGTGRVHKLYEAYKECLVCHGRGLTRDGKNLCPTCKGSGQRESLDEDGAGGGAGGGAGAGATGGAPANSAGLGHIAGLGVPAGSKFGEPGGPNPLGGYTSKKKRKHYKESKQEPIIDVMEWDQVPKPIEGGGMFPEEIDKSDIEKAAAAVHDQWMDNQKKSGHTEHKSPDGKEDYMVPYDELKEKSKKLDRDAVKATIDALKLDEWWDKQSGPPKSWKREECPACDGKGMDWGETCITCGGSGVLYIDKQGDSHYSFELDEERETFAGSPVFEVDTDKWMKSRFGKNRYHRYSRYVGEDEGGEAIRHHGRTQRKDDIILKDQATGAMTYFLRRKKTGK